MALRSRNSRRSAGLIAVVLAMICLGGKWGDSPTVGASHGPTDGRPNGADSATQALERSRPLPIRSVPSPTLDMGAGPPVSTVLIVDGSASMSFTLDEKESFFDHARSLALAERASAPVPGACRLVLLGRLARVVDPALLERSFSRGRVSVAESLEAVLDGLAHAPRSVAAPRLHVLSDGGAGAFPADLRRLVVRARALSVQIDATAFLPSRGGRALLQEMVEATGGSYRELP